MGDASAAELYQIIQQLAADRSRFETILRQLPLAVIVADAPDGRVVLQNEHAERILRHTFSDDWHVDSYRSYQGYRNGGSPLEPDEWPLSRALKLGEVVEAEEIDVIRGDGSHVTIRVNSAPLREAGGAITGAVVVFDDVTAGRRNEAALAFLTRASELLSASLDYETTLANVVDLIVPGLADWCVVDIVDDVGAIRRLAMKHRDPSFEPLLVELEEQYPHEPGAATPPMSVIRSGEPTFHPTVAAEGVERAARGERHRELLRLLDIRSYICVPLIARSRSLGAISFVYSSSGRVFEPDDLALARELAGRVAVAIDNSRLFASESAVAAENARLYRESQSAEARYRGLIDYAGDTILVSDDEGRFLDVNPAASELLGYSRAELLTMGIADLTALGSAWTAGEFDKFMAQGYWTGELDLRRKDGAIVPVEAKATVVSLGADAVYLSVIRDISHRRETELMQREFMTIVTHDLKSPLTSIKGFAQLMQRRRMYSDAAVNAIVGQSQHLERLINDLLDAARLEAGRSELRREQVDLTALARTVAGYSQALTRGHVIRVELPAGELRGHWDGDRVSQVIQNLLSNAISYSPAGGDIVVTVGESSASGGRREAFVAIQDSGIGIPPSALERIFERFYRHDSEHSGSRGLGLGLYISRSLVEAHGGRITVSSEPGSGSTFRFTLPVEG
ncbi:MAG TPA: ATP-binding protein [Thermomicrobiales bacterium]|nr:ATP-binding protein [Thermomicrobiales bacterium]